MKKEAAKRENELSDALLESGQKNKPSRSDDDEKEFNPRVDDG